MRAVTQRVLEASVTVMENGQGTQVASIGRGYLILIGVRTDDAAADAQYLAEKIAGLRVWEDADGKLNRSIGEVGGAALLVSNFTLYADCRKGRRPGFSEAAPGSVAEPLYRAFGAALEALGVPAQYGVFGAEMRVALVNDGPVTLLLDSRRGF